VAPGSIVASYPLFGATIATSTAAAPSAIWPTTLGGTTVSVKDSTGTSRTAQIAYSSPGQVNFVVPSGTATGVATVTMTAGGSSVSGSLNVVATYPNLFTANTTGLAAAYALNPLTGAITADSQPIYAGSASAPVYLVLFGSGLGSATSVTSTTVTSTTVTSTTATATIGGVNATLSYAGTPGTYPGLDQYNILIPPSLAGKGQVDVIVTVAGLPSNTVNITLQ
jgi:uncharacterized protein (TIGR03437 family)